MNNFAAGGYCTFSDCLAHIVQNQRSAILNYKHNRYILCVSRLQPITKSYIQHTYLLKIIEIFPRPGLDASASLLSHVLC